MIVDVATDRPYQVHIAHGNIARIPQFVEDAQRVAILHPPTVAPLVGRISDVLEEHEVVEIEVPDAEEAKTGQVLTACWDVLAECGFTRSDVVIGVGGGATTDLAGFVAATWLRGVRFITVPTSVLGMVDAAVGGKTGINIDAGKNLVGAFHEPAAVVCDLDALVDLPPEELAPGMAEVVKGGFIADPTILDLIEEDPADALDPRSERLAELITRKVRVKAAVVAGDLRERTSVGTHVGREVLNYGHTLGHAVERHERYRWRHGNAISVGMVFAAELSAELGLLEHSTVDRHRTVLASLGLPTTYSAPWEQLRSAMSLDKKTRGQALRFVLLEELAQPRMVVGPDEQQLTAAYRRLAD